MIAIYLFLLIALLFERVSVLTLAAWFSILWGTPMIVEGYPSLAGIIYAVYAFLCIVINKLFPEKQEINQVPQEFFKLIFYLFFLLSLVVVALDGGFDGFLQGKYSGVVPSGNLQIYYLWNSLLLIVCVLAFNTQRVGLVKVSVLVLSLSLLLISGDRTILGLVLASYIFYALRGKRPIDYLKNIRKVMIILIFGFILYVGKDFYAYYSLGYDFKRIISDINPSEIFYRLEFWHNYNMINNIYSANFQYDVLDYISEFLSVIPMVHLGVDPHNFSLLIKERFYSEWSVGAGVGGNYFGQGFAAGGVIGLVFSAFFLVGLQLIVARLIEARSQIFFLLGVVVLPVVVFYVHRNSLAQFMSFVGRYGMVTLAIYTLYKVLVSSSGRSVLCLKRSMLSYYR